MDNDQSLQRSDVLNVLAEWFPDHQDLVSSNSKLIDRYIQNPSEENERAVAECLEQYFDQHIRGTELAEAIRGTSDGERFQASDFTKCEYAIVKFSISFVSLLLAAFGTKIPARLHDSKVVAEVILEFAAKIVPKVLRIVEAKTDKEKVEILLSILSLFYEVGALGKIFEVVVEEMSWQEKAWFVLKVAAIIFAGIATGSGALIVQLLLLVESGAECIGHAFEVAECCK